MPYRHVGCGGHVQMDKATEKLACLGCGFVGLRLEMLEAYKPAQPAPVKMQIKAAEHREQIHKRSDTVGLP